VTTVIVISGTFTIPIAWEIDFEKEAQILMASDLRLNFYYFVFYFGGLHLIVLGILPLTFLLYYNYRIVGVVKRYSEISEQQATNANEGQNIIRVLGGIIFSFLVMHSLRLIITFGEFFVLLTSYMNNEMWCLQRGYGVPVWLEIATEANKMLKVIHSSINVILYLYLNSRELVKEWPIHAPNCLKRPNNKACSRLDPIAAMFGTFNLSTLILCGIKNNNGLNMRNGQHRCQFQVRKLGTEYL
jgi:hypothetical protein